MDYTAIILAVLGFLGTVIGVYYKFRSDISQTKKETTKNNQTAIRAANELLFTQIQTELTRRDKRIEELEHKLDELEKEEEKRKALLEAERNLNRKISLEFEHERQLRIQLENDFNKLKTRVLELEKENKRLKNKLNKIETGELSKDSIDE